MSFFAKVLEFLRRIVPFGVLVRNKPRHYREMLRVMWENRGRWAYALAILRHGVCDGCSLGPRGLRDDVLPGAHLCLTRLKLLRLNTMGPIADAALGDVEALRALSNEELHHLGRIPYPLLRRTGERGFSRISWDEATRMVAERMKATDPDAMGMFVTSRGLTNETYYLLQKLWRIGGSPHIDSCARLCHAASSVGLKQSIGWGAPTISLRDLVGSDLILVIGSNLPNNQPVSTKYLRAARKAGSRIVVVNPFREPALERYWIPSVLPSSIFGTRLMDDYFPVRPGGDIAFMTGLLKVASELGTWDEKFLAERTTGAEELRAHVARTPWAEIVRDSGIAEAELRRVGEMYARARSMVIVYSMGLTQYDFGVENVRMVANVVLARGMIGREKCGILPIRGHSGVQGTAECGADADKLPGAVDINDENCRRFEAAYRHSIPRRTGLRAAHLLDRAGQRGLELLYLVGGNHLETMPDRRHAQRALQAVGLRVHQDIVLNTTTLLDAREAVLVLPAATRYEQPGGGTSTSTERRIRYSPEIPGPRIGEAKPEWEIAALIGQRLEPDRPDLFGYADAGAVRREMADVMPLYSGIERLEKEGDWVQWGGERLGASGFPNMPDGRARLAVVKIPRIDVPEGRFLLTTRRGKQFNSLSYGKKDPLTGGTGRSDVLLDPRDIAALGLTEGAPVDVVSEYGTMQGQARGAPCRRQHAQAFFPEANALLTRKYDPQSGEPDYATIVEVRRREN
jgi:molybdopterin-dependent oxidoreductase alpha subunit